MQHPTVPNVQYGVLCCVVLLSPPLSSVVNRIMIVYILCSVVCFVYQIRVVCELWPDNGVANEVCVSGYQQA